MSARPRRKPVFDPNALDDELDELLSPPPPVAPATKAPASSADLGEAPDRLSRTASAAAVSDLSAERDANPTRTESVDSGRHLNAVPAPDSAPKRTRPPEALLSSEVYDELYRVQIAEKKARRGLARPMGVIVLDAIEAHAGRLASTWANQPAASVGEGQLFERPASTAVPRRRRHVTAPRTVVLSGVTVANAQRLDDLVKFWDAGTRSALVEQALRYEFDLMP
jgi:hypothetical protein